MLHVRTLGGLRQTSDGDARPLRRKPLALLSYVARRGPGPVTRTELATLFWGERGEERTRQSLRQALLELKQTLGDKIDIGTDAVRIDAAAVDLDIVAFERDLSEGRVLEAVGRWTGDFFEGAEDIGGDGFRRWLENERASLHKQLGAAMARLIGDAELAGDWTGAAAWAQRWAAALPFDEAAHLRLIEALRMSGRSGDALKTHAAYVTRIRTALDVEPSAEFLRLGGGLADTARDEMTRRGRGSAAVFPVRIPPLRERSSDIPLLVKHFLAELQRKLAKPLQAVTEDSMRRLQAYPWPGNIRELQNVLERACVMATTPIVEVEDALPIAIVIDRPRTGGNVVTLDENERAHIRRALAATGGKIHGPRGAATILDINPSLPCDLAWRSSGSKQPND